MDRRTIFVLLFLVLVVVGAGITYYKAKHKKHKVKKIIKIPYKYNYSVEILRPTSFVIMVNVTKAGNVNQYLHVAMYCFNKYKHKLMEIPIRNTSISIPMVFRSYGHGKIIYNDFKQDYLSKCLNYTLKLCDSFTGKCKIINFKSEPWNYSVNVSFPTNYSIYINITPTKVRFHRDTLRVVVVKKYLNPVNGQYTNQTVGIRTVRPYGMISPNKPNVTKVNFTWRYIGSYKAIVEVFINETNTKQTIYHKSFIISPRFIYLGKSVEIPRTSITITPEPGSKLTFNRSITLENEKIKQSRVYKCRSIGSSTYCPGAVKLEIVNNGRTSYRLVVPGNLILCVNSLGQAFPSMLGSGVFPVPPATLYAGASLTTNLVCYMLNNSIPYLMYFRIYVNGKIYEYNLILSTYSRTMTYKYNYTIIPISPNTVQLHVNVTSIGTAPENLQVKEYCLLDNGTIVKLGSSTGYSLQNFVHKPNVLIPVYYGPYSGTCKDVIFNVCDSYTGKCSNISISRGPWTYSVLASLLSNYTLKIVIIPVKQTLHKDVLKIIVNMTKNNPYTGAKITTTIKTITLTPSFSAYGQEPKTYTYVVNWTSIDSPVARINVKVVEVRTHTIIYETNYTVTPKIIKMTYTYYIGKNATITPVQLLTPEGKYLNLSYNENGKIVYDNLTCVQKGASTYCPVAVEIRLSNIGTSSHNIIISSNLIFCKSDLGKLYTSAVGTGVVGPLSQIYAPNQTTYGYLYCYINQGSKLSEMYVNIRIDNKIYEYLIKV